MLILYKLNRGHKSIMFPEPIHSQTLLSDSAEMLTILLARSISETFFPQSHFESLSVALISPSNGGENLLCRHAEQLNLAYYAFIFACPSIALSLSNKKISTRRCLCFIFRCIAIHKPFQYPGQFCRLPAHSFLLALTNCDLCIFFFYDNLRHGSSIIFQTTACSPS